MRRPTDVKLQQPSFASRSDLQDAQPIWPQISRGISDSVYTACCTCFAAALLYRDLGKGRAAVCVQILVRLDSVCQAKNSLQKGSVQITHGECFAVDLSRDQLNLCFECPAGWTGMLARLSLSSCLLMGRAGSVLPACLAGMQGRPNRTLVHPGPCSCMQVHTAGSAYFAHPAGLAGMLAQWRLCSSLLLSRAGSLGSACLATVRACPNEGPTHRHLY